MPTTIPYDRRAAVAYANQWALGRNPAYGNFDNMGGDCTNFISQCVFAGCGVMNYTPELGWYYTSLSQRAPAWTGVTFFRQFLTTNKERPASVGWVGPYATELAMEPSYIYFFPEATPQPGDVIQLGDRTGHFYHTTMITQILADGTDNRTLQSNQILVAAHTFNTKDRPLSTYFYGNIRFLLIEGCRK